MVYSIAHFAVVAAVGSIICLLEKVSLLHRCPHHLYEALTLYIIKEIA
jgi:hypothetical protein